MVDDMGRKWNRLVLFIKKVQRRLSRSYYKRLITQNGDKSLNGLDIDWHLAEYDYPASPIGDTNPVYAYA